MKRFYIPFLLMAAAVVAACETRIAIEEPVVSDGSYVYTLTATAPAITKSDYTDAGKFNWTEGDKISVLFHNGNDNKFFTFAASSIDGASATFTGQIESGYEIGASTDGTKWALYPAGEHGVRFGETDGEKFPLTFHIPAITDYTKDGFSANIPMYAQGDADNKFEFLHLGAAYKFTFTDIEASKVKFLVENQTTYRLSGDVKLRNQGGTYLDQAWADGADKTLTYISNVTNGTAVFYVPVRYYAECFQPIISLCDDETGDQIYAKTATVAKGLEKGHVQPINISVSGAVVVPWSFPSAYDIDWNEVTASAAGDTGEGYDGIVCLKATADASNLYVYFEIKNSALFDDAGYHYSNYSHLYIGDGTGEKKSWAWEAPYVHSFTSWLKYNNAPRYINWNDGFVGQSNTEHNGNICYEVAIARASYSALSGSSITLCMDANKLYVVGEEWQGEETQIGFAPARWQDALVVTLP